MFWIRNSISSETDRSISVWDCVFDEALRWWRSDEGRRSFCPWTQWHVQWNTRTCNSLHASIHIMFIIISSELHCEHKCTISELLSELIAHAFIHKDSCSRSTSWGQVCSCLLKLNSRWHHVARSRSSSAWRHYDGFHDLHHVIHFKQLLLCKYIYSSTVL